MPRLLLTLALLLLPVAAQAQDAAAQAAELEAVRLNAERGNAASQYALGLRYANGAGGAERDPAEALRWYRLSGEQGHVPAQFAVAAMYDRGVGVAADPVEAARWYEAAARQGHAGAQHNLAVAYEEGRGVGRSLPLARQWYTEAAGAGLAQSQIRLAEMLAEGLGGAADLVGAAQWYQVAAVQGVAVAQARLGLAFGEGRGIDRADRAALLWLEVAARRSVEEPGLAAARDAVAARVDPAVRDAAIADADACALANWHYCGNPIAPPGTPTGAHRTVAAALEQGTHPDIVRPDLLQGVQPQYPVQAVLNLGRAGEIVLDALLLADGRVGPICVRQSLGPALDAAAVAAAVQWRFSPATRGGEGVPAWVRLELSVSPGSPPAQ
jgi:TonB family protein